MIIRVFDPRAGKRIAIEVADPTATAPPQPRAEAPGAPPSGHGPEHRQEGEDDHDEDQHEAEHAAAAKKLPRETFEDHGALDCVE